MGGEEREGREEGGRRWLDDKGQRRCVPHSLVPFVRIRSVTGDQRRGRGAGCHEEHFSPNADKLFLQPKDNRYLRGKEAACVLGEEMLILALILKGPGRSITLSSLRKRKINMFLKA